VDCSLIELKKGANCNDELSLTYKITNTNDMGILFDTPVYLVEARPSINGVQKARFNVANVVLEKKGDFKLFKQVIPYASCSRDLNREIEFNVIAKSGDSCPQCPKSTSLIVNSDAPKVCDVGLIVSCVPPESGSPCISVTETLCTTRPKQMELMFTGGRCEDSEQSQGDKFICDLSLDNIRNVNSAYIRIVGKDGETYFTGVVNKGEIFTMGTQSDRVQADSDVFIYTDSTQTSLLQQFRFHTSCSQNLSSGDIFGGITIVAFITDAGRKEGGLSSTMDLSFEVSNKNTEDDVFFNKVVYTVQGSGTRTQKLRFTLAPGKNRVTLKENVPIGNGGIVNARLIGAMDTDIREVCTYEKNFTVYSL